MEIPNNSQTALARQEDIVIQNMPDEVLVYDLQQHKAHCLNRTAAFIWRHCDGQTTVTEMTKLLQQEEGTLIDEEVIWYTLEKLSKADLLEGKINLPVKDAMSRRRMIRRMGALIAVPTVLSLVAPTAFAGASVVVLDYKIPVGQCIQQSNPANCDDRCCSGNPDESGDKRQCVSAIPLTPPFSCTGPSCVSTGPSRACTPSGT